ncbi:hypothetical protein PsyrH_26230 [Pseudomonas syringae pv. syringae HS191]|uniref:Uncharacterized protein n=1 Tax=Pseudomonas syringae TaxID=317 RepID=A0AB38BYW7_PSESX|nr:hypothetical protein PsyrH_26230 [Pseudomonas syringae pv. syringae HS191]SFO42080.1 hypothetical protein SAMN05444065_117100 [Pseudomonas syringae]SFO75452.1 hypothetical protein SAMN05444063_118100 [Pseudomonas syringae]
MVERFFLDITVYLREVRFVNWKAGLKRSSHCEMHSPLATFGTPKEKTY